MWGMIENYKLEFLPDKNPAAEWKIEFPMFLKPFYKFLLLKNSLPRQHEFYEYYLNENHAFFEAKDFDKETMSGLKARTYRTYPSLVRDIHFAIFMKAHFCGGEVIYNRKLDYYEGIDLLLVSRARFWGINLFADTDRSRFGRKKKISRHSPFSNVHYIDLPVCFQDHAKCGQFYLYGKNEFEQLMQKMEEEKA